MFASQSSFSQHKGEKPNISKLSYNGGQAYGCALEVAAEGDELSTTKMTDGPVESRMITIPKR